MTPLQVAKAALEALLNRDWYDHGAVIAARNEIRAALARIAELEAQPPAAEPAKCTETLGTPRTAGGMLRCNLPDGHDGLHSADEPAKALWAEAGHPPDMPCVRCGAKREDPKWNICADCYGPAKGDER